MSKHLMEDDDRNCQFCRNMATVPGKPGICACKQCVLLRDSDAAKKLFHWHSYLKSGELARPPVAWKEARVCAAYIEMRDAEAIG